MENVTVNITLTVAQVNVILNALGKGAYAEVAELIGLIKAQAQPQVDAWVAENTPPVEQSESE